MGKKIVILNGSPRKNGNTSALVRKFTEGAESAGNMVTEFFLDHMEGTMVVYFYHLQKKLSHQLLPFLLLQQPLLQYLDHFEVSFPCCNHVTTHK